MKMNALLISPWSTTVKHISLKWHGIVSRVSREDWTLLLKGFFFYRPDNDCFQEALDYTKNCFFNKFPRHNEVSRSPEKCQSDQSWGVEDKIPSVGIFDTFSKIDFFLAFYPTVDTSFVQKDGGLLSPYFFKEAPFAAALDTHKA